MWSFTNKILQYNQTSQQLDERLQRIKELNNNMNGLLTPKTLDTNQTTKLWSHKAINRYLELHNNRCSFWTKAWDTTIFYNHWDNNANFQSLWPTAVTRPTVKPDRFNRKRKKPLQLNLEEDTDVREGYLAYADDKQHMLALQMEHSSHTTIIKMAHQMLPYRITRV